MLNLNRVIVTKQGLLTHLQDIDVYRRYTNQEVVLKVAIKSPLRKESNPSFGYFIGESGEICFRDFILGGGDFVKFVQLKFDLNFFEALSKIAIDFELTDDFFVKELPKDNIIYDSKNFKDREKVFKDNIELKLAKKRRDWKAYDFAYWLQFGIDTNTLRKYRTEPLQYIFINDNPISVDKYAYVYIEMKENKYTYKIYQPFSKKFKWLNNHNNSIWQGWEQLPETGEKLVITKSLKDVMAIDNATGIPTVSLQSEAILPKPHIMNQLKARFKTIYLLYDNDYDKDINYGHQFGKKIADTFELIQVEINACHQSKDFSDLVKNIGQEKASKILEDLVSVPF